MAYLPHRRLAYKVCACFFERIKEAMTNQKTVD